MAVPTRPVAAGLAAAVLSLLCGCKPDAPIRTYTVPKDTAAKATPPDADAEPKYRMLGAVIPAEPGYSWFVKFVGPIETVDPLAADFDTFVKSIRPDDKKPTWTAPPKWTEAAARPTRLATYQNGAVEMYLSGPFGGSLLDNVNRWRKEVGLRALKESELKDAVAEVKLGEKTAYTVDLRGPTWSGGMAGKPPSGK